MPPTSTGAPTYPAGPPRIAPVSDPDASQRAILDKAPVRSDGSTRNIFLTLAHSPLLLKRFNAFAGTFFISDLVSDYDRELLVLRVAARTGSRYEYAQHLSIAREAGLDDHTIAAAMLQPDAFTPSPADSFLLAVADRYLESGNLHDGEWAQLRARFSEAAALHVLFIIGFYRMTGEVLNTVGIAAEDDPDLVVDWAAAASASPMS
jgi:alkylhydroperoxidase family enzyme